MTGFKIAVSKCLTGGKRAVKQGDTIYVSPAMYDLIKHADQAELRLLLEKIEIIEILKPPSLYEPLPMTTAPRFTPESFERSMIRRYFDS